MPYGGQTHRGSERGGPDAAVSAGFRQGSHEMGTLERKGFSMNRIRISFALAAALVVGLASQSFADQIQFKGFGLSDQFTIMHNGNTSTEYAGQLRVNVTQNGVTNSFDAYCVDLDNDIVNKWTATKQPDTIIDNWTASGVGRRVGFLYDTFSAGVDTNLKAAALQAAIWEILDDGPTSLDIRNGDFKLMGNDAKTNAIATQAAAYLAALPANVEMYNPGSYVLYSDNNPRSQHLIVPEPGSLILLGMAIPMSILRRRRAAR